MLDVTPDQVKSIAKSCKNPESVAENFNKFSLSFGIVSSLRRAHFFAQCAHESASFNVTSENLNYSQEGLQKVFPKYFPDSNIAWRYARQPQAIANRVYASRMGNGPESSGDGWKYRGAGYIQLTGRNNQEAFAKAAGIDLNAVGDYLRTPVGAMHSACWFWAQNGLNQLSEADDLRAVTKRVNGGFNGLDDRAKYLKLAKEVFK